MIVTEGRGRASSWGCTMCGGRMVYDIGSGDLKCQSCGKYADLAIYDEPELPEDGGMDVNEFSCSQCGASLQTTDTSMTGMCSYCGSGLSFRQRMTRARRPGRIVPFQIGQEKCAQIYTRRMQEAVFASGRDREAQDAKHFRPVYVPFYVYTERWNGSFNARSVHRHSDADYHYTDTYRIEGEGEVIVKGEVQCASSQFEPEIAERLQLDLHKAVPFRPGYLCGFYAEAPDMDANLKESELEFLAEKALGWEVTSQTGKGSVTPVLPDKVQDDYELVLMPVWLLARADGQRVLYTAINGVDGTIVCDTPTEPKRPLKLGLGLGVLFALVLMLLSGMLILRANVIAGACSLITAVGFMMVNHARREVDEREKRLQEQREVKRCRPMKEQEYLKASRSVLGGEIAAEVILTVLMGAAIAMTFVLVAMLAHGVVEALPFGLLTALVDIAFVKVFKSRREKRAFTSVLQEWLLVWFLKAAALAAVVFLYTYADSNMNTAIAGLVSDRAWLPPFVCAFALVTMLRQLPPASVSRTSRCCYWLSAALCVAGAVLMLVMHEQLIYYGVAALQMVLLLATMYEQILHYNDYVSRPVPYFGRKGVRV